MFGAVECSALLGERWLSWRIASEIVRLLQVRVFIDDKSIPNLGVRVARDCGLFDLFVACIMKWIVVVHDPHVLVSAKARLYK